MRRLVLACRELFKPPAAPPAGVFDALRAIRPADVGLARARARHARALARCVGYLHCADGGGGGGGGGGGDLGAGWEVGVFVLPPGAAIPLHDHPQMSVFSRLLDGTVRVQGYDWVAASVPGRARLSVDTEKRSGDVWCLSPEEGGNVHTITAGPNGAAMLDVISPPYDERNGRPCTYWRLQSGATGDVILEECPQSGLPVRWLPHELPS